MDVILYTRHQCSACEQVKKYLNQKGVEYEILNIQEDTLAAMRLIQDGVRAVPVLEIDGERFVGAKEIVNAI